MADKLSVITYGAAVSKTKKLISDIPSPFTFKGFVPTVDDLPDDAEVGDLYVVSATQIKYAWDGTEWGEYGEYADIDPITNEQIDALFVENSEGGGS